MEHKACKIPVIVGIAVGSLIVISILWCFIRCCMCGYACCSCCCGGCGGRRHKREKNAPVLGPMPVQFHPSDNAGPQFAYYDTRSEDALPAMPTVGKNEVNVHVLNDKEIEMTPVSGGGNNPNHIETNRAPSPMGMQQVGGPNGHHLAGPDHRAMSPAASSVYTDMNPQYAGTGYDGHPQQPRPTYMGHQQPPSFVTLDPRASPAPQQQYGGGYDDMGYQRNPPPQYGGPMGPYGQQQQGHPGQQQGYAEDVEHGRRPQQQWTVL